MKEIEGISFQRLNIPDNALEKYYEKQYYLTSARQYLESVGLDAKVYLSEGGNASKGDVGIRYEVGMGLISLLKSIDTGKFIEEFPHLFDVGKVELDLGIQTALLVFSDVSQHRMLTSQQANNAQMTEQVLCAAAITKYPIILPFVMCPDVDYEHGGITHVLSLARKTELKQLLSLRDICWNYGIVADLLTIVGNDWFHPVARGYSKDPKSVSPEDVALSVTQIKDYMEKQLTQKSITNPGACEVVCITELDEFNYYQSLYNEILEQVKNPSSILSIYAKALFEKSMNKTSKYYLSLRDNLELMLTVIEEDIALYISTSELFTRLIANKKLGGFIGGIGLSMESDKTSFSRFYLNGSLTIPILNLKGSAKKE